MNAYIKTLNLPRNIWAREERAKRTTVTIDPEAAKFNPNDRKDDGLYKGMTLIDLKTGAEVVTVRWYCPTGRRVYCCLWIHAGNLYTSGSGRAGGYGYDRASCAFEEAITQAGVKGFPRFGGSGCNREAVEWLGRVLGVKRAHVVEFYA